MTENNLKEIQDQLKAKARSIHMIENPGDYDYVDWDETFGIDPDGASEDRLNEIAMDQGLDVLVRSAFVADQQDMLPYNYKIMLTLGGPTVWIEGTLREAGIPETAVLKCSVGSNTRMFFSKDDTYRDAFLNFARRFAF